jgi:ribosomal protein S2
VEMKRLEKCMTPFEYGFATQFGLYFGTIEKQSKNDKEKYIFKEKTDEIYMKDVVVRSFVEVG